MSTPQHCKGGNEGWVKDTAVSRTLTVGLHVVHAGACLRMRMPY